MSKKPNLYHQTQENLRALCGELERIADDPACPDHISCRIYEAVLAASNEEVRAMEEFKAWAQEVGAM